MASSPSLAERMQDLTAHASSQGHSDVLSQFSLDYLECVLDDFQESPVHKVLDALLLCIRAREKLHVLERGMDRAFFARLVTGGFLVRAGVDRATGGPVSWVGEGGFRVATRDLSVDTPKGMAALRAYVWLFETIAVQTDRRVGKRFAVYFLMEGPGRGGVNMRMVQQGIALCEELFPAFRPMAPRFFGFPNFIPLLYNTGRHMLPPDRFRAELHASPADVLDLITDPADVPGFWFEEDQCVGRYARERTVTWCYERCLSEHNRVRTKDLFNPGPWPYQDAELGPEVDRDTYSGRGAAYDAGKNRSACAMTGDDEAKALQAQVCTRKSGRIRKKLATKKLETGQRLPEQELESICEAVEDDS